MEHVDQKTIPLSGLPFSTRPLIAPRRLALKLSLIYILLCSAYIWLSGQAVASLSQNLTELQYFELVKGLLFVFFSGLAFFFVSSYFLAQIAHKEEQIFQQQNAFVESERRALAGLIASAVAHDINNALMALEAESVILEEKDACHENAERVRQSVQNLRKLSGQLLTIGRKGVEGDFEHLDLEAEARDALNMIKNHARVKKCQIDVDAAGPVNLKANSMTVHQMVYNLVLNAADATGNEGHVRIKVYTKELWAILEVHDDGPGIPEDKRKKVFEPFYSSKQHGTGLGLLSLEACVKMHGGKVEIEDSPLGGACFRISLPLE